MDFVITDDTRFDENKRLFSERRICVPRERLRPNLALDTTLCYRLAAEYLNALEQAGGLLMKVHVVSDGIEIRLRGVGLALKFGPGEPQVTEQRASICWPIIGGWALDRGVGDGGTFTVGAEWDEARQRLTIFTRIEAYPSAVAGAKAPRLRRLAYRLTQQRVHVYYTNRFLLEAAREVTEEDY